MTRKKYILKNEEISTLIRGIIENGPQETFNRMMEKAISSIEKIDDLDEMFLDMSEDFLDKFRIEPGEEPDSKQIKDIYLLLHSMLRNLAHKMSILYIKNGRNEPAGIRFIRLISYNKEISTFSPKEI